MLNARKVHELMPIEFHLNLPISCKIVELLIVDVDEQVAAEFFLRRPKLIGTQIEDGLKQKSGKAAFDWTIETVDGRKI